MISKANTSRACIVRAARSSFRVHSSRPAVCSGLPRVDWREVDTLECLVMMMNDHNAAQNEEEHTKTMISLSQIGQNTLGHEALITEVAFNTISRGKRSAKQDRMIVNRMMIDIARNGTPTEEGWREGMEAILQQRGGVTKSHDE